MVLLAPGHQATPFVMFVRPRDPAQETWTGRRAGVEGAMRDFGADVAFGRGELGDKLVDLVMGADEIHYPFGHEPEMDASSPGARQAAGGRAARAAGAARLCDARTTLHEMRLIKTPDEIAVLRRAAAITGEAHTAAIRAARTGTLEHEIEALSTTLSAGAGERARLLDDRRRRRQRHHPPLRGERGPARARTAPAHRRRLRGRRLHRRRDPHVAVGAPFSSAQRRLYEAVLDTQLAAIDAVKPGATIDGIHQQVVERLTGARTWSRSACSPARSRL